MHISNCKKSLKNPALNGGSNPDLCDAGSAEKTVMIMRIGMNVFDHAGPFFNQWEAKLKPIAPGTPGFSRALSS